MFKFQRKTEREELKLQSTYYLSIALNWIRNNYSEL